MSNVVSIDCTCDYLVRRAARHRRAGRYDEAMALLWKAQNLFPIDEDVQLEMARVYDEIGCDGEAVRSYLRVVRLGGSHAAQALFHLSLSSAQHGDLQRAVSYYERFRQSGSQTEIPEEMVVLLGRQLFQDERRKGFGSSKSRAKALEKRAASSLQAGRITAARRAIQHALRLKPSAQRYTMLACCYLLAMDFEAAIEAAQTAHEISHGNVQTLCVLCDAYTAAGDHTRAKKALALAALRSKETDDVLAVAIESAKLGDDAMTLCLTERLLRKAPFHTRGMKLRACALINTGKREEAERILGRLCGLLPEDSVCESYYKLLRSGSTFEERLTLGMDVIRREGIDRASEIISAALADSKEIDAESGRIVRLCRLGEWVLHSPMAGSSVKTAALILLSSLSDERAKQVLLDALTDSSLSDSQKLSILQVLTAKHGFYPYDADIGGKLVRLAAGGVSAQPVKSVEANSRIVQRVADRLSAQDPDAPGKLLPVYLGYLDDYGKPDAAHENAFTAALEYWYQLQSGSVADPGRIAQSWDISVRQLRLFLRRIEKSIQERE